MKYYEIPDEATFNAVAGSLGTFRIRTLMISMRSKSYVVMGDCDRYPNAEILLEIKDVTLFRNLVNVALEVERKNDENDE